MFQPKPNRVPCPADDGFTLAELMIVVLVMAILMSAGVPTYQAAKSRAQDGAAKSVLHSALSVAAAFSASNDAGLWPQSSELTSNDTALTYLAPTVASTEPNTVSSSASPTVFKASAMSKSGTCQSVASVNGVVTWGTGATPCDGNFFVSKTVAGSGTGTWSDGTGSAAQVRYPYGLEVDPSGSGLIYIADTYNHRIRAMTADGVMTTLAGQAGYGFTNGTGSAAQFKYPRDIAVDGSGNLYVADTDNYAIRKITPAGVVTTLAGSGVSGSADGTGTGASFVSPFSLALDSAGNIFVADSTVIRKVTPAGVVTTWLSSGMLTLNAIEVDSAGTVYVSDGPNCIVRKITAAKVMSILAGGAGCGLADGTGTAASMRPLGLAMDWNGYLWFADVGSSIRKISPAGVVTTVVGNGSNGDVEGVGSGARFWVARAVAASSDGTIYVADTSNHKIRKLI